MCPVSGMPNYDRRDPEKAYEQVTGDIRKVMRSIEEKLRVHAGKHRDKSSDWGFVGDVSEVLKRLQEIHDFIADEKPG